MFIKVSMRMRDHGTGFEDPTHLLHRFTLIYYITQPVTHSDGIKVPIWERQVKGIAFDPPSRPHLPPRYFSLLSLIIYNI